MGWNRVQHAKPEYKRSRHASIPLCIEKVFRVWEDVTGNTQNCAFPGPLSPVL